MISGRMAQTTCLPLLVALLLTTAPVGAVELQAPPVNSKEAAAAFLDNALKGATAQVAEDPRRAQAGDLVTVDYTLTLADGSLVATTRPRVAADGKRKRSDLFKAVPVYAAEELVVGGPASVPGIAVGVTGLTVGATNRLQLTAEQGYGPVNPAALASFPKVRTVPRSLQVSAEAYLQQFNVLPAVGKRVPLSPYFDGTVTEVGETQVTLVADVSGEKRFEESFGSVLVASAGDTITMTLTPRLKAPFPLQQHTGTITAVGSDTFTVDFNHPLAGKPLLLELELRSLTKASTFRDKTVQWLEGLDQALAEAKTADKPVVLVLYADWCGFCKKLFNETVVDPRVKVLKDRFVWVKVNSEKEKELYQRYGQQGYPLTVLLKADGTVAEKIDGFRDGAAFSKLLRGMLAGPGAVAGK
jgi:FKBP-type peptidyl-prolyl cis-trans isomerase 2